MANSTIYPYGTGGTLPSNIGIINDLTTGGADKALSAQQGVVLRETIEAATKDAPVNYVNGVALGTNGETGLDATRFISIPIPVSQGDTVYWHYGAAGSIRLVEYAADGTKIEYWGNNATNARTITINNAGTAYIVASFDATQFADSYVDVNGVRAYTASDGEFCKGAEAWQLVNALYGGEKYVKHIPSIEWSNDGYYINTSGEYDTYSGMGYSNVIPVPKGQTLVADLAAGNATSAISLVDAAGTFIKTIAVGIGLDFISRYTYTADDDSYVILSSKSQTTHPYVGYLYDTSAGNADVIFQGDLKGAGDSFASAYFQVNPGDYMRIWFTDGNWETRQMREGYNKFSIVINDAEGNEVYVTEFAREPWPIPAYGYDFYVSPYLQGPFPLVCRIAIRAKSGITVPVVVLRLSQDTPKPYFATELTDTIGKLRNLQARKSLTLAVCTDLHYRDIGEGYRPFAQYSALGMMVNMREMAKVVRFDNVVCLGDAIDGRWSAAQALRDAHDMMRFFGGIRVPLLYTLGNHDDNRYFSAQGGDRQLTAQEMFGYFVLPDDERIESDGSMANCNWYRDIERHQIRIIAPIGITFNGAYGFTQETQTWFASAFTSLPSGYKAIVITHEPMVSEQGWAGAPSGAINMVNIITANISRVICVIFGHTHIDNVYLDPYTAINIASSKAYGMAEGGMDEAPEDAWFPERAAGDVTEQLWDVVSLDQDNSIISFIRFGAGVDRHIHYTPIEVAAGNSVTLTPSIITATAWHVRASESSSISITSGGVVTVVSGATVGARLTARAEDADGNYEYFIIKVV